MSNRIFTQIHIARNSRQSHSRGYGRPKTRSPFPDGTFAPKGRPQMICLGKRAIREFVNEPIRGTNITAPAYKGIGIFPQRPKVKSVQHQFLSLTKDERHNSEYNSEKLTKADSLDIESSYNLTFYHPNVQSENKAVRTKWKDERTQGYELFIKRHLRKGVKVGDTLGKVTNISPVFAVNGKRGFSREKNLPECFKNVKYTQRKQHSRIGSRGVIAHSREGVKNMNSFDVRRIQML